MKRPNAASSKGLPVAERKARVAALVAAGKVSAKAAKLIDYREPSAKVRAFARKLEGRAKDFLAKDRRAAA